MHSTLRALAVVLGAVGIVATPLDGQRYSIDTEGELARWIARDPAVTGAIDIHYHGDPDSTFDRKDFKEAFHGDESNPDGRTGQFDILEMAKIARASGMRGFVFKSKRIDPAPLAYVVRQVVPGVEVFGGMSIDRPFGLNPTAIDVMASVEGGWGRVVFVVAEDSVTPARGLERSIPISKNGELLPETKTVITKIASTRTRGSNGHLVMATGHNSPAESLMLVREGRKAGVKGMVVTHPGANWTIEQLKEAAGLGAFIEVTCLFSFLPVERLGGKLDEAAHQRALQWIRTIGAEHIIVSTDVGRMHSGDKLGGNPTSPQAFAMAANVLRGDGISERQISLMFKDNPARLLGLPVLSAASAGDAPRELGSLFVSGGGPVQAPRKIPAPR